MRSLMKTMATALMLSCMGGNAWVTTANAAGCASSDDMLAIRAAAVKQTLMVAAFSCQAKSSYNNFVTTYQKDLQASDRALKNFFKRQNAKTGTADFHAFKTRLANNASLRNIRDTRSYCATATETFNAASSNANKSLAAFLNGRTTAVDDAYKPCQVLTASSNATTPP